MLSWFLSSKSLMGWEEWVRAEYLEEKNHRKFKRSRHKREILK